MSNDKPKLADIAKQNNSAKVSKFAKTMVPAPPIEQSEPITPVESPVLAKVIDQGGAEVAEGKGTSFTREELQAKIPPSEAAPASKLARKRGNQLSLDDILIPKAPDKEGFPKIARISEKHHDLLRMIAYQQKKPMNTILYNLLETLDQAYQRDQSNPQNHA